MISKKVRQKVGELMYGHDKRDSEIVWEIHKNTMRIKNLVEKYPDKKGSIIGSIVGGIILVLDYDERLRLLDLVKQNQPENNLHMIQDLKVLKELIHRLEEEERK